MRQSENGKPANGKVFTIRTVVDREEAGRVMEELGFRQTEEAGVYLREVRSDRACPAYRHFEAVRLDDLLSRPRAWALFVRRNRARVASQSVPSVDGEHL